MRFNHPLMYRPNWPAIFLALIVIATVILPGDSRWLCDEPLLMNGALIYNARPCHIGPISLPFTPALTGIIGTRGVRYGPLAAWTDQIFLAFTHNPITIMAVRIALVTVGNVLGLYWLCKTLKFSPWLAVIVMLSPWLWLYSRQLWDNSLCVPLCALLFSGYADFLANRRAISLFLAIFCALMMLLIHLMSVALVGALAIHLLVFESRSLWRYKWIIAAMIVIVFAASAPYWVFFFHNFQRDIPPDASAVQGFLYPFFGAHHLSAAGLDDIFGLNWQWIDPDKLLLTQRISFIAYPVVWAGMLLSLIKIIRWKNPTTRDFIFLLAWLTLIFQCILDAVQHVSTGPQYYNATWMIYVLFAMLTIDTILKSRRIPKLVPQTITAIYAASLLFIILTLAINVHRNAGTLSDNYGATISNQIAAINEIHKFSPQSPRLIEYKEWELFPVAMNILDQLIPAPPGPKPTADLLIHFRNAHPGDAVIAVTPQSPQSPASPP